MIELEKASFSYGGKRGLDNISVLFEDAKVAALLGANGSSKSTLLGVASGRLRISSGAVRIDGKDASALSAKERSQLVSVLPQSRNIPDITAFSLALHGRFPYLSYPRIYSKEDLEKTAKALRDAGAYELKDRRMAELSGGERQRVYLAMVINQDTKNVLLDEPATFLDLARQAELVDMLGRLARMGKCVVAVFHDINLAAQCADHFAVMRDGRITAFGKPAEVIESGALGEALGVEITARAWYGVKSEKN
ncbi:MAG: ABC transporter ATP-binding protein [Clostridiales bacterium]|nr:ABC transporter ATP-binding protein [Clostridiales bacterium]